MPKTNADSFTAITTQADLDRVIGDRLTREREKFADYEDLKAKAAKFDDVEAAKATDDEKTAKRISDLEAKLADTARESLRLRIATTHGITDPEDIELYLTGADEATLAKQAKGLADKAADRKKNGNRVPKEGSNSSSAEPDPEREFVRTLFGSGE